MPIDIQFPGNLGQVDTIAKLRQVPTSGVDAETVYIAMDVGRTYSFDFGSLLNDDGINVIRPNDRMPLQAGRFIYLVDGFAPGKPGAAGPAGPADNTYTTLAALLASDGSRKSARLVPQVGEAAPAGNFNYINGAWVRQEATGIRYDTRRSVQARLDLTVYATDTRFAGGAVGDGVADDYAAIQAALNFVQSSGGGTVIVPLRHRITQGLKIGTYSRLVGPTAVRFPFNAGNTNAPAIVADFADPMQWVIDCDSRINGQPLAYNDFYTGALPNGAIYDCGVADLLVTSTGNLPFGGIRMAGVPGSTVQDVGIHRVGCGLLSNVCFGSFYSVHCLVAYYGIVGWDDWNGNTVEGYVARDGAYTGDVPAAYRLKPMNTLATKLVSDYGMASNAHTARSTGVMIGSLGSTSNNNSIGIVCERFDTGYFLLFAYSLGLTKSYVEASAAQTVLAAAQSTVVFDTSHAYYSGTGAFFDIGVATDADMRLNGSVFVGGFGTVSTATNTNILLRGVTIDAFGPTNPQFNVLYERRGFFRNLALENSWGTAGAYTMPAYRREDDGVVLRGAVSGGANGSTIATLPPGYRPATTMPFRDFDVQSSGAIMAKTGGTVYLDARWQVEPV